MRAHLRLRTHLLCPGADLLRSGAGLRLRTGLRLRAELRLRPRLRLPPSPPAQGPVLVAEELLRQA